MGPHQSREAPTVTAREPGRWVELLPPRRNSMRPSISGSTTRVAVIAHRVRCDGGFAVATLVGAIHATEDVAAMLFAKDSNYLVGFFSFCALAADGFEPLRRAELRASRRFTFAKRARSAASRWSRTPSSS
jgi:hypothetical protein